MRLRKHHWLVDDAWFCDRITVQGPGACAEAAFPCYRWVQGEDILSLPEGTGEKAALGKEAQGPGNCCGARRTELMTVGADLEDVWAQRKRSVGNPGCWTGNGKEL